jgi:hypothetical protein
VTGSLKLKTFPGALYDWDGKLLAGDGPDFTCALVDALPYKALIRNWPGNVEFAVLERGDKLWLLPESFGTPLDLPAELLADLADVIRRGGQVGLAAQERAPYEQARDALMLLLDDSGGRA